MDLRRRVFAVAVLFVFAIVLSGCTSITCSAPPNKGKLIRTKRVWVMPVFGETRRVYSKGVQKNGNILLFINWNVWQDKPQPAAVAEETAEACCVAPPAPPTAAAPDNTD